MSFTKENLRVLLATIEPVDQKIMAQAQHRLDNLTKPLGALGMLEDMAKRMCGIQVSLTPSVARKMILTFAGDHGVVAEGVSAVPAEVTPQMVANFLAGGAGVNVLAKHVGAEVRVIDVGVAVPVVGEGLILAKVKAGTDNIRKGPAMSEDEALAALGVGVEVARNAINDGAEILGTGEMGIGNTTPSAALFSAFLNLPAAQVTGRGTGISDEALTHKIQVVEDALAINAARCRDPLSTLAALGGLEIAAICGMILEAARQRVAVVVDGFISSAAALTAMEMNPTVLDYCFFSHMSGEQGHRLFFEKTGLKPILHLGLRLGEGTGAALAMNLIEAGVKILTQMATFGEAGVSPGEILDGSDGA
ncbi:MAG: nicotinate-nucleotide--dimethylbenzimidazole phosphoribosyltransferase [Proteobacteria bacterium]|nr:nicotinate-nucleotide--dimethylbenzimidazole phosphoribosyltransferase [Pseudomonadota bacterium]MBU1639069.1 nicotinate-nucleotide--dimethylbenzimidazole phosphoribosyltransferase [Pseudomonadota bacterium]